MPTLPDADPVPDRYPPTLPAHRPLRVLMVCLGNICRSPTAEAVLRQRAEAAGVGDRVVVDSAGTGDWHVGAPPDARAIAHAARRGVVLDELRARVVTPDDFGRFDLVLAMDRANLDTLRSLKPDGSAARVGLLLDWAGRPGEEVPDPYGGGAAGFERVLDLAEAAADGLVQRLQGSRAA